ncbi:MAG: lipid-A-disaccharide synthase [Nitrospirae bacterium]|nr:lipid-A-disaccharide synthase [Nitrospirota bacterium]
MSRKLMISAGEASGELYGAMLSREVKKLWPDADIFGIGGSRMKNEGVNLIAPISQVVGILEAIRHIGEVRDTLKKAEETMISRKPDILVLIDYPDFNLLLAKKAKAAGIPVLYYVSPQVWAWRRGRVKKIARLADRMAVLFPFEVDYYKDTGLPCEFVGHPVAETINILQTKEEAKKNLRLAPDKRVITLLPGSRPSEIRRHQKILKEVAEKIHHEFPDMQIVIPLTPESHLTESFPGYVNIIRGCTTEAVTCSEVSAAASGTATLEIALLGTPMAVFYKVSPLTYHLVKPFVTVKFISLVNILAGKEIVKEMIQKDANPEKIFSEIKRILTDVPYRNNMIFSLNKIKDIFQGKHPSVRVAQIAGEIGGWKTTAHV